MVTHIIGISGHAEAGKDVAAGFITTVYPSKYYRRAFADALKVEALKLWCAQGKTPYTDLMFDLLIPERVLILANTLKEQDPAFRSFLQTYATKLREQNPTYWVERLVNDHTASKRKETLVIPDVRALNEVEWVHQQGGLVLRIERPGHENRLTPEQRGHWSETELDDYPGGPQYHYLENVGNPVHLLKLVLAEVDAYNGWRR